LSNDGSPKVVSTMTVPYYVGSSNDGLPTMSVRLMDGLPAYVSLPTMSVRLIGIGLLLT